MNDNLIGIVVYVLGCLAYALGPNIQKYALQSEENGSKKMLWMSGVTIYISAGILWSIALIFASITILAPILSLAVVFNFMFARIMNGEVLTRTHLYSGSFIVVSIVLTALSARKVGETEFEVIENEPCKDNMDHLDEWLNTFPGVCWVLAAALLLGIWTLMVKQLNESSMLVPFTYGTIAGFYGGAASVTIQALIYFIKIVIAGKCVYPFKQITFAFGIIFALVMEVEQLNWINRGLERYDASFIATMEIIVNEVTASTGGVFLFHGMDALTESVDVALYVFGMLFAFGGCVLLCFANAGLSPLSSDLNDVSMPMDGDTGLLQATTDDMMGSTRPSRPSHLSSSMTMDGIRLQTKEMRNPMASNLVTESTVAADLRRSRFSLATDNSIVDESDPSHSSDDVGDYNYEVL